MSYRGLIYLAFLTFVISPNTLAQQNTELSKKELRKAKKQNKIDEGRFMLLPLVGPAYTPELKLTIAGGLMMSFKTNRNDSLIQRSSAPVMLGISTTGAYFIGTKLTSFWFQDKLRIYGDFDFKHMPDNYWGVGYDAGRYVEKSDITTAYTRTWWRVYPKFLWQFKKNYFSGLLVDYNYTQGSEASPGVAADPTYVEFNNKPFNSGIGVIFQYDSRDIPINSWKGLFIEASAGWYRTGLGGDNNYEIYLLDLRKYFQIGKKEGRTLAAQIKGRFGIGDVPYGEMSQLGTPYDLRGYLWGRYRHNSMWYGIAEYRHMFYKANGERSKHGAVVWLGTGSIGKDVNSFKEYIASFGIGYRLEVQPRMNLRVDFGFGTQTFGFYFNFNEAY